MKICILSSLYAHGGASQVAKDIAKGMAQRRHEVYFICSGQSYSISKKHGYRVITLANRLKTPLYHYINPLLLHMLKKIIDRTKPDIINIHNINLQTFSLGTLLFSRRCPMIWTIHDLWPLCVTGWPNPFDCHGMLQQCNECSSWPFIITKINKYLKETIFRHSKINVLVPSNWLASLLLSSSLSHHPISIIYHGIPTPHDNAVTKEKAKKNKVIPHGKKILMFPGGKRLANKYPGERKGWEYLANALSILARKRNDLHLLYIGDRIASDIDFPVPITFIEDVNRDKMANYYYTSDVFILPTIADNFPLTVLEAIACKLPVITTEVGGIPEIIKHGETGLLCPPRDAGALAASIDYLLSNPEVGIKMAEKAHKLYLDKFRIEQMLDRYEELYRKAITIRRQN